MKPWKVMYNDCCIKRYKRKCNAIKRAQVVKSAAPSDIDICVSSNFEIITIN